MFPGVFYETRLSAQVTCQYIRTISCRVDNLRFDKRSLSCAIIGVILRPTSVLHGPEI